MSAPILSPEKLFPVKRRMRFPQIGKVTYIADQAEFTPRNVQTVDSRSTTVYLVEITLPNSDHSLKPGMPADATFK